MVSATTNDIESSSVTIQVHVTKEEYDSLRNLVRASDRGFYEYIQDIIRQHLLTVPQPTPLDLVSLLSPSTVSAPLPGSPLTARSWTDAIAHRNSDGGAFPIEA